MNKYESIINYNYQMKHKRMTIHNRSAQFSPFSALVGYEELIIEKGRETNKKIELSIDEKKSLDIKLHIINNNLSSKPKIIITYFVKDLKKDGGKYEMCEDYIKKIDFTNGKIVLNNNLVIKNEDILEIDSHDININDIM